MTGAEWSLWNVYLMVRNQNKRFKRRTEPISGVICTARLVVYFALPLNFNFLIRISIRIGEWKEYAEFFLFHGAKFNRD